MFILSTFLKMNNLLAFFMIVSMAFVPTSIAESNGERDNSKDFSPSLLAVPAAIVLPFAVLFGCIMEMFESVPMNGFVIIILSYAVCAFTSDGSASIVLAEAWAHGVTALFYFAGISVGAFLGACSRG